MRKFNYVKNKKCCFEVGHYNKEKAIRIAIVEEDTGKYIRTLTVLDKDNDYEIGLATIYNGNLLKYGTSKYRTGTEFLQDLGIIEKIWETYDINLDGIHSIPVAVCSINLNILAEYSRCWKYWEYEPEM